MSMETQSIPFSVFHKSAFQNNYPYVITEDICTQFIRNLQNGITAAGRRRKLAEIGNYQLPPSKKIALEPSPKPKPQPANKDRINALPDELLLEIFRFISGPADRYSCASVCMRWLMLQTHLNPKDLKGCELKQPGDELKRIVEGRRATDVRLALASLGTQGRGGLGKLTIRGGPKQSPTKGITEVGFSAVAIGCGALKSLSVWDCPTLNDAAFSWIGKGCHELTTLNVLNCRGFGDAGLQAIAKGCPGLTSVTLEGCDNVSDEGLKAVAQYCPQLAVLSVVNCKRVGDAGVTAVVTKCNHLKALKLERVNLRDAGLVTVGQHGKTLQKLKIVNLDGITTLGFTSFGRNSTMEQLKHIHIESCPGFTDGFLGDFAKVAKMVKLISLINCKVVTLNQLVSFMNDSNSLEGVHLEKCSLVSSSVFPDYATSKCTTLKSVVIHRCEGAEGGFLGRLIGDSCLKKLDLTGSSKLTDEELAGVFASCKSSLATLTLSGCAKLTNKTVGAISGCSSSLESLALDGCVGITDLGLHLIAKSCLSLRELDVSKCTITDSGILALLASRGSSMKTLSIAGCIYITGRILELIERDCSSLDALNVKDCISIDHFSLDEFESRFTSCQVCC